ncbi:MAG: CRTAC1 family protein, partial [Phycisphaerae bacterium]
DWDQNRYPDIYLTNIPFGNVLFMNNGDETFSSFAAPAGVQCFGYGWGTVFFDVDNDRFDDLYMCNQDINNRLYKYEGSWPCVDVALTAGVHAPGISFVVATADIDNDGDVDLAVQNRDVPLQLFINQNQSNSNRWIKLRVVGEGANLFAVGAVVEIRTDDQWQQRQILAGNNFKSQNDLTVHFGMRSANSVGEIRVLWPGGATRTLSNLSANSTWTIYPEERLGDADGDGVVGLADGDVLLACVQSGSPVPLLPGCEMMDFDGDGDIDAIDGGQFLAAWDGPGAPPQIAGLTAGVPAIGSWGYGIVLLALLATGSVMFRRLGAALA